MTTCIGVNSAAIASSVVRLWLCVVGICIVFTAMAAATARGMGGASVTCVLCGRNLESSLRGAGISYDKWHQANVKPTMSAQV